MLKVFNTLFRAFHNWLRKSECSLGRLNCWTECISKQNSSNAENWLLISCVKVAKQRFTKHFSQDENNFLEDNFSIKLIYQQVFFFSQDGNKYQWWTKTDVIVCNSFASENYKQLQKSKKFKIGEGSSLKWEK